MTLLLALIPSFLSCAISIFYAYLEYKRSKEPTKDEVWETATKIICSNGGNVYSDDFAELYSELKFFKENPEFVKQHSSIRNAMNAMKAKPESQ
jgi:hypothetical protein